MKNLTSMNITTNKSYQFLLYSAIIISAFNLRPAITSIGPVIGLIRDDIGLSNGSVGIITSLPLLAFSIMSPLASKIGNSYSNELAILIGLILLSLGILIRSFDSITLLYSGTFLTGIGIAFCNVLLPAIIKEKFPDKLSTMTGVYSTAMGIMAAIASALSIPIAEGIGLGWKAALIFWLIPAFIGIVIWFFLLPKTPAKHELTQKEDFFPNSRIWKSALAWQVTLFMGFQSFLFYVTISWLPEILHDYGASISASGWMLSFIQLIGLPISFLVPFLAGKFLSQWKIVIFLSLFGVSGYSGLLIGHSYFVMVISVIFIGVYIGGIFPLALTILGLRVRNAREASILSGMAQSVGYLLAAIGPTFIGYLYDISESWTLPIMLIISMGFIVMILGSLSGRNKYILD